MIVALIIILAIIVIKYTPAYEVKLNGDVIGYVNSKSEMEEIVNNEILISDNPNAVFTALNIEPTYSFKFVNRDNINENEVKEQLEQEKTTMYKIYAITLNNEVKSYVNTWDEAEKVVEEMKNDYQDSIELNIAVVEKYTENMNEFAVVQLAEAQTSLNSDLRIIKDEQEKIAQATCNGVYFSVKPVIGNISSRYGAVESVRDHVHSGIDITAPAGTAIKAVAQGTVSYAGWMSGYGNFVIIDHENGVQTCYGHCSKIYTYVGATVQAGDKIAAVGSTGNSTGNHLHFEVRINGEKINPQNYLYK